MNYRVQKYRFQDTFTACGTPVHASPRHRNSRPSAKLTLALGARICDARRTQAHRVACDGPGAFSRSFDGCLELRGHMRRSGSFNVLRSTIVVAAFAGGASQVTAQSNVVAPDRGESGSTVTGNAAASDASSAHAATTSACTIRVI